MMGLCNKWNNKIKEQKEKIDNQKSHKCFVERWGRAGCLDCGRVVGPRLEEVRSGTGFPGLAAASKKFPVEHSSAGAGAAGAAVDLGGSGRG